MKRKRKRLLYAGTAVALILFTTVLVILIRDQPDVERKQEISTQQSKEEVYESTENSGEEHTEEVRSEEAVTVYGTGHLYYLDPEGDQAFERGLTDFVKDQGIEADRADVLDYCIDDRDRENEPAQFFLELDNDRHSIVRVSFEKTTGAYTFHLYDGFVPDEDETGSRAEEEKEIPESTEDVEVPKSKLTITDPEGELTAVAKMKKLKKQLRKFLRSEEEGRRNFYVSSVEVTEDGYVAVLNFETVRQDGRNVEVTYDGDYHFRFV